MVSGSGGTPPVRRSVDEMEEYVPISTPEALAEKLGLRLDQIVKLDGNENPYGPSPRVRRALAEFDGYHRYPDPWQQEARGDLARFLGVPVDSLMLGMGSDELIDDILRIYLEPGDEVIDFSPTFGMYPFSTRVCGGRVVDVPRTPTFEIDLEGALRRVTDRTRVIMLASPNNPSGNLARPEEIRRLLATGRLVVVDEAYAEFSGTSMIPMVAEHPNLVVLRTFSKWAGLAGLRVGYGVFPVGVIRHIWKIKQPYNLNVAAQVAVRESLADAGLLLDNVRKIVLERERLAAELNKLDFLRTYESSANFILCDLLEGSAEEVVSFLASRGLIIRYFRKPRLFNSIRISVGLPEHTGMVIDALKEWHSRQAGSGLMAGSR
ncbi:MAG TPA: histidinol-phosphate transaminase [Chloroflexota bacterium]